MLITKRYREVTEVRWRLLENNHRQSVQVAYKEDVRYVLNLSLLKTNIWQNFRGSLNLFISNMRSFLYDCFMDYYNF
jgi:hypothetical protein